MTALTASVEPTKRQFVHRLFTTIAPRYDWFNRLASCGLDQRWRRQAVAEGRLAPEMRVLDLCTGTGDLAFLCARQLQHRGVVVGSDFNAVMLQGARRKQARHEGSVRWVCADSQTLPFGSGSFDRVMVGFSTRNLSDLALGVREMLRVLKSGGRLIILETGRPSNPVVRAGYLVFLMTIVRAIGMILTGRLWPFTYLARSIKEFLSPPQVVALLSSCGAVARYQPLSFGLASLYIADKH